MKIAFANWENRIAPVFDTAQQLQVVEIARGKILGESREALPEDMVVQKALRLVELNIDVLVCGAISRSLQGLVAAYGIQVVPFVAGNLADVVDAFCQGNLMREAFAMPGCRGRERQRGRGKHDFYKENFTMRSKGQSFGQARGRGQSQGKGSGQGLNGQQRSGRMGGNKAAGPSGNCVCPGCGQIVPHERGMPCVERKCSKCGIAMIRG